MDLRAGALLQRGFLAHEVVQSQFRGHPIVVFPLSGENCSMISRREILERLVASARANDLASSASDFEDLYDEAGLPV